MTKKETVKTEMPKIKVIATTSLQWNRTQRAD